MQVLFVFILGLIVGSFLNAVIFRLHSKERIVKGRSHCQWCRRQLKWYELIPLVSFVLQKGRCRYCRRSISWQYPLVELVTALLFICVLAAVQNQGLEPVGFWQRWEDLFFYTQVLRGFVFVSFLLIIFVFDLKHYLILDKVTIPAMVAAFVFNILLYPNWRYVFFLLLAAIIGGGFFLLQYLISQGKWIGGGDIRLGVVMGFMLGWPKIVTALVIAYIVGALFSLGLLVLKKKKLNSQIPFGTFLAVGTFLALFWADNLYQWYANYLYKLI